MTIWSRMIPVVILGGLLTLPARAQTTVWTALVPQGFPENVYRWQLKPDGRYSEDGRDAKTGAPIQPTLFGHWRVTGGHMVLTQDGIAYVFKGDIVGDQYLGVVYLDGKRFSRFCASRGESPPRSCAGISS